MLYAPKVVLMTQTTFVFEPVIKVCTKVFVVFGARRDTSDVFSLSSV